MIRIAQTALGMLGLISYICLAGEAMAQDESSAPQKTSLERDPGADWAQGVSVDKQDRADQRVIRRE